MVMKNANTLNLQVETKNIPIIFLTVNNSEHNKIKGFELGASDYIVKPFRPKTDMHRIAIHLKYTECLRKTENLNYLNKSSKHLLVYGKCNERTIRFY